MGILKIFWRQTSVAVYEQILTTEKYRCLIDIKNYNTSRWIDKPENGLY